jgi:hypothetical protein
MLAQGITAIGLLSAGCTHDPLVVRNVYPGLVAAEAPEGALTQVLFSADGVPAQQGLLYIAMYDAGVAGQNASLARAAATAEGAKSRVGEVLYAIDPEIAPAWPAKDSGIVEVWAGSGYGLRRSIPRMIDDIRGALDRDSASAALPSSAPRMPCKGRSGCARSASRCSPPPRMPSSIHSCASWTRRRPLSTMAYRRPTTRAVDCSRRFSIWSRSTSTRRTAACSGRNLTVRPGPGVGRWLPHQWPWPA